MEKEFLNKGIFRNCLGSRVTENEVIPLRFTEKQYKVYDKTEALRLRSYCTAGVCLHFRTNSTFLRFNYTINEKSRDWIYFDVYINDLFVDSIGEVCPDYKDGCFHYEISKTGREINLITVYLPHNVVLSLKDIELSDGAYAEVVEPYHKSLLCLGDSITQGMDAYRPSSTYPVLLSRYLGMNLLNQGVGGYVFCADSLDETLSYKPDIVTVAYGTNDWGKYSSIGEFQNHCKEYMEKLTDCFREAKIYVMTPLWRKDMDELRQTGRLVDISNEIRGICNGFSSICLIDGMELLPHIADYMGDGRVHPNDEGFLHIARNLTKRMGAI